MKKYGWILLLCILIVTVPACSRQLSPAERVSETEHTAVADEPGLEPTVSEAPENEVTPEASKEEPPEDTGSTVLVAYFSQYAIMADSARTADGISSASIAPGDVERIAGMIRDAAGADLFEIAAAQPYPNDYDGVAQRAGQEAGTRPELAGTVEDMDRYEVVYLGYPVWAGSQPMPVSTFLESYDFTGKTIIPFCTYENYIADDVWMQIAEAVPEAVVAEGYAISLLNNNRPTVEGIEDWLAGLGLLDGEQGGAN